MDAAGVSVCVWEGNSLPDNGIPSKRGHYAQRLLKQADGESLVLCIASADSCTSVLQPFISSCILLRLVHYFFSFSHAHTHTCPIHHSPNPPPSPSSLCFNPFTSEIKINMQMSDVCKFDPCNKFLHVSQKHKTLALLSASMRKWWHFLKGGL